MKIKTSRPKAALAAFFAAILLLGANQVVARASQGGAVQAIKMVTDVEAGQVITAADIQPMTIHGQVTGLATQKDVVNKVAVYDLTAGQLVMANQVGNDDEREGLKSGEVGMRVGVDLVTSGGVLPGDHVDVLVSGKTQTPINQQATVQPIERYLRVISVVTSANEAITKPVAPARSGGSLTSSGINSQVPAAVELAVTPDQAEQLALSEANGKLTLVVDPWPQTQALGQTQGQGQGLPAINPPVPLAAAQGQGTPNQTTGSGSGK